MVRQVLEESLVLGMNEDLEQQAQQKLEAIAFLVEDS